MGKKPTIKPKPKPAIQRVKKTVKDASAKKAIVPSKKSLSSHSLIDINNLDNLPKAALVLDAKMLTILDCNRAACELYDFSATQLKERSLLSLTIPSEQSVAKHWLQKNKNSSKELHQTRSDGAILHIEFSIASMDETAPKRFLCLLHDVTSRSRLVRALLESDSEHREIIENANDIIYTHDLKGNFTSVNRAVTQVLGYTSEEALKLNLKQVVVPEHHLRAADATMNKVAGNTATATYELDILTKEGKRVSVEVSTRLVHRDGEAVAVQGIARDLTQRRVVERALRESEAKFRTLADSAPCAIVIHQDSKLVYANQMACDLSGYSMDELQHGEKLWDFAIGQSRDEIRKRLLARERGEHVTNRFESEMISGKGKHVWVDVTASPIEYGGRPAVVAMLYDITDRKLAEQSVKQSEQRFRTVIENTSDIITLLDPEGIIQYESPSIMPRLGYEPQELVGKNGFELVHPEDLEAAKLGFLRGLEDADAYPTISLRVRHKQGFYRRFEAVSKELREDGKVTGLLVTFRDVTERTRQEEDLRASEERFRLLFERNLAGVYVTTLDGKILDCNESFARIYGYETRQEMLTRQASILYMDTNDRTEFMVRLHQAGVFTNMESRGRRKDGTEVWVLENTQLVPGMNGAPDRIEGTMIDITERKHAEHALMESEKKFRAVADTASSAIYIHNNRKFLYVNKASETISGFTALELLNMNPMDIVHPDDRALVTRRATDRTQGNNVPDRYEFRIQHKNGQTAWLDFSASITAFEGEAAILATAFDITERKHSEAALRESESKFRAVADTTTCGICIHDNQQFLYLNRAAENITGYKLKKMLGQNPFQFVHPEDKERFANYEKMRQTGGNAPAQYEGRIVTPEGKVRWIEVSGSLIQFEGKKCVLGTIFDITERKRVEKMQAALYRIAEEANGARELHDFYVAIHGIISELMFARNFYIALHDPVTQTIHYPYDVDEFDAPLRGAYPLRRGCTEYVLRKGHPALITPEVFQRLLTEGEVESVGADSVDWMGAPLREGGQTFGIIALQSYSHEVRFTESDLEVLNFVSQHLANAILRKRNEEALRVSELRYRTLFRSAVCGIYRAGRDNSFLEANPTLVQMLGYNSEAELLALNPTYEVFVEQSERDRLHQSFELNDRLEHLEVKWKHKDKGLITVRLSGRVVRNADQEVECYEMIAEDVTERRGLEEQLRQSQKMEAVGRLAGGIAHDFNNLLTVIKGYSELMLEELRDADPMKSEVEEIKKAADRAASLTKQLLAFSRQQVLAPKVLDLNAVVINMDKLIKRLIGEDVELHTALETSLGQVKADLGQIEQVLMNLAVNARDAMPNGGRLTVETMNVTLDELYVREHMGSRAGSYVALLVSDNGSGMTDEVRQRIFEPFFTTKEAGKGTGLGLSTVYGIVKQSEGYVWVYSEPNIGTSFKIYLPRVDAPADKTISQPVHLDSQRGTETVLLVEDEDGVRALIRQVLHKHGYMVLEARHGGEALLQCERHKGPIELLLTDVVLEQMSGRELAERLCPMRPEMKVLYVSGYTDDAILHHGVLNPGTAFLQKPFTTEALARKIREVLGSKPIESATPMPNTIQ